MTDVFISYKRRVRPIVSEYAEALRSLGLEVWFDAAIDPGSSFSEEISREVRTAKCVLACFTDDVFPHGGDEGGWVVGEATIGRRRKVLVAVVVEPTDFDPPWNTVHVEDLIGFTPLQQGDRSQWKRMLVAIGRLVERPGLSSLDDALSSRSSEALRDWARNYPADPMAPFMLDIGESERAPTPPTDAAPEQADLAARLELIQPSIEIPVPSFVGPVSEIRTFEPQVSQWWDNAASQSADPGEGPTDAASDHDAPASSESEPPPTVMEEFLEGIERRRVATSPTQRLASLFQSLPSLQRGAVILALVVIAFVLIGMFGVDRKPEVAKAIPADTSSTSSASSNTPTSSTNVATAFKWKAEKFQSGTWEMTGVVPSANVAWRLSTLVSTSGSGAGVVDRATSASGAPADFETEAKAGIQALVTLDEGVIAFDGTSWQLRGVAKSSADRDGATQRLYAAAGKVPWRVSVSVAPSRAAPQKAASPKDSSTSAKFLWQATKWSSGEYRFTGGVPTAAVKQILGTYGEVVFDETKVLSGAPSNFEVNARAGLGVIQQLIDGTLTFNGSRWMLSGHTNSEADREELTLLLQATVTTFSDWIVDITVTATEALVNRGYVEVASDSSEDGAYQAADLFSNLYPDLVSQGSLRVTPLSTGSGGTQYRVNLVLPTYSLALAVCAKIKTEGGECRVVAVSEPADEGF